MTDDVAILVLEQVKRAEASLERIAQQLEDLNRRADRMLADLRAMAR